jgi:hypothetical protein
MQSTPNDAGESEALVQMSKEHLELAKLELEIAALRKPLWKHPSFWASAASILVVLAGAIISWANGWFDVKQTEIKNANMVLQAQNETLSVTKEHLTEETEKLDSERSVLNSDLVRLKEGKITGQADLLLLTNELLQLERQRDEKEVVIRMLNSRIDDVTKKNDQMQQIVSQFDKIESARDKAETESVNLRERLKLNIERARQTILDASAVLDTLDGVRLDNEKFRDYAEKQTAYAIDVGKWRAGVDDDIARFKLPAFGSTNDASASVSPKK